MPAVGGVLLWVIVIEAVAVQPLAPVPVTVYVFGDVTLTAALVPNPPVQEYEVPPVAVRLIEVVVQLSTVVPVLFVIPAVGGVLLWVMVMEAVAVQPLAPVTVTVYVFGAVTLAAALVPEDPPDQE